MALGSISLPHTVQVGAPNSIGSAIDFCPGEKLMIGMLARHGAAFRPGVKRCTPTGSISPSPRISGRKQSVAEVANYKSQQQLRGAAQPVLRMRSAALRTRIQRCNGRLRMRSGRDVLLRRGSGIAVVGRGGEVGPRPAAGGVRSGSHLH
ncbi:hypothetical protein [Kitasatospora camelliae]|uniref:Uncharacterized protein n=1 Tax=Kitasatospora camelliae TaxID=3156397 RepID=A0AAU8K6P3_9ACTN